MMNKINDCIFEKEYREVTTYMVNVKCPKCGTGCLISDGRVKFINGEYYSIHTCNNLNCKNTESIKDFYPKVEYVFKETLNKEKEDKKSITTNKKCSCPIKRMFRRNNR